MEPLWSPVVATGGNRWQIGESRKPQKEAKSVAIGCDRLPDGKEGVDGSSPSEGFEKRPAKRTLRYPNRKRLGRAGTRGLLLAFPRRSRVRTEFGLFRGIGRPLTPFLPSREYTPSHRQGGSERWSRASMSSPSPSTTSNARSSSIATDSAYRRRASSQPTSSTRRRARRAQSSSSSSRAGSS